jgi:isopentenyl-diphosphate delta-isomerase type 1
MSGEQWFEIVDEKDQVIGLATRRECHGNPDLVHRVAHVLVVNRDGQLLLQKRSMTKDVQPGRWDTSVGGHLDPGEGYRAAALREMREELGIADVPIEFLYYSQIRNDFESENIATFLTCYNGEICFDPGEIDAVRFFSAEEISLRLGEGFFTPNFEEEWLLYNSWCQTHPGTEV